MINLESGKFSKTYPISTILISRYELPTNMNRIVIVQEINRIKSASHLFTGKILLSDVDDYMLGGLFNFSHFELF